MRNAFSSSKRLVTSRMIAPMAVMAPFVSRKGKIENSTEIRAPSLRSAANAREIYDVLTA